MEGNGSRHRRLGVALVAALGVIAMLALPSFAAARARGHHHANNHARHHLMSRHRNRMVLIRGTASNAAGSLAEQENAGEVESFDGTTLTIKLFAGGTISGKVTESTEIECEHQSTETQASEDGQEGQEGQDNQGEDQQSGDQSQQSEDQPGDQSGDEGDSSDTEDQGSSSPSGSCGTASLTPGAVVHEAELEVGSHGAVFHSVHLAG